MVPFSIELSSCLLLIQSQKKKNTHSTIQLKTCTWRNKQCLMWLFVCRKKTETLYRLAQRYKCERITSLWTKTVRLCGTATFLIPQRVFIHHIVSHEIGENTPQQKHTHSIASHDMIDVVYFELKCISTCCCYAFRLDFILRC